MNSDVITQTLQTGFHMALGATATLVEEVQDWQKLDVTVRRLTQDFGGLSQEWVDKGALTEQEARNMVASLLQGQLPETVWPNQDGYRTINTTADTVSGTDAATELKELTAQIAQLRSELERLQGNDL